MADDDESLPNRLVEPLKDAVGRIHDENLLFPSVLGILIVISAVALAAMQAASYVIFAVLGGLLVLLLLTILLRHFSPRAPDPPEDRDPPPLESSSEPASSTDPYLITVDDHGTYVGGTDAVSTDCIVSMLSLPVEQRRVVVRSLPLADRSFRLKNPGPYLRLQKGIAAFEEAANILVTGRVHYSGHDADPDLLILCLRRLWEAQGIATFPHATWFSWRSTDLSDVVAFAMPLDQIELEREYDDPEHGEQEFGAYALRVEEMYPSFNWEFVFPAILTHEVADGSLRDSDLELNGWLIGSSTPDQLQDGKSTQRRRPAGG